MQMNLVVMFKTTAIMACEEKHFRGLHSALSVVAAEKKYLASTEAPPFEVFADFYRSVLANMLPLYDVFSEN
jgi:hypothetical protein